MAKKKQSTRTRRRAEMVRFWRANDMIHRENEALQEEVRDLRAVRTNALDLNTRLMKKLAMAEGALVMAEHLVADAAAALRTLGADDLRDVVKLCLEAIEHRRELVDEAITALEIQR